MTPSGLYLVYALFGPTLFAVCAAVWRFRNVRETTPEHMVNVVVWPVALIVFGIAWVRTLFDLTQVWTCSALNVANSWDMFVLFDECGDVTTALLAKIVACSSLIIGVAIFAYFFVWYSLDNTRIACFAIGTAFFLQLANLILLSASANTPLPLQVTIALWFAYAFCHSIQVYWRTVVRVGRRTHSCFSSCAESTSAYEQRHYGDEEMPSADSSSGSSNPSVPITGAVQVAPAATALSSASLYTRAGSAQSATTNQVTIAYPYVDFESKTADSNYSDSVPSTTAVNLPPPTTAAITATSLPPPVAGGAGRVPVNFPPPPPYVRSAVSGTSVSRVATNAHVEA